MVVCGSLFSDKTYEYRARFSEQFRASPEHDTDIRRSSSLVDVTVSACNRQYMDGPREGRCPQSEWVRYTYRQKKRTQFETYYSTQ